MCLYHLPLRRPLICSSVRARAVHMPCSTKKRVLVTSKVLGQGVMSTHHTPTKYRRIMAAGTKNFQQNAMSWSVRSRG